ncbi:MAG: 23S rRNA (adenine(2503)-C(2))-methyltransferase RlmN [Syntrophales bacterium]
MDKPNLKDMSLMEVESFIAALGKEKYRAKQIMNWLYRRGAETLEEMTTLTRDFRDKLGEIVRIGQPEINRVQTSQYGTKKILFKLEDGLFIESVLIPGKNHWTVCVSTQAGCRMGCKFCLTGKYGFKRNLLPSEITGQITALRFNVPEGGAMKNIVMMGMGEPLDNYENTLKALRIITSPGGLGFSNRKITISTCGLTPMIRRLGNDVCVNLAISLNAPDNETRSRIMPINRKYPLDGLLKVCRDYPMPRRRMLTFEYVMLKDINVSPHHAESLARLLSGIHCKLNLIPLNNIPGSPFSTPSEGDINIFREILIKHRYTAIIRASKGSDILAACGQLSGQAS